MRYTGSNRLMSTPFTYALATADFPALRARAKADLHVHAIGGGSRAYLQERTGRDIAPVSAHRVVNGRSARLGGG